MTFKLLRWITVPLKFEILRHRSLKSKDFIFIFTDGRSGGTILLEALCKGLNGISLFEPFNPNSKLHKKYRSYFYYPIRGTTPIDEKDFINEFLMAFNTLDGISPKSVILNSISKTVNGSKVIAKVENISHLLPYLVDNSVMLNPPMLILRNPIEVLLSMINYGYWQYQVESSFTPSNISKDHVFYPFRSEYYQLRTNYEYYIFMWCVRSHNLLKNKVIRDKVPLITYGDIKRKNFTTIFNAYPKINKEKFKIRMNRPSVSSNKKNTIDSDWFMNKHRERFNEIIRIFDFSKLNEEAFRLD